LNNSRFSSATYLLREKLFYAIALLILISRVILNSALAHAQAVRAGFPQLNGGQTPLWTISEAKLDRKYGIEIRPIFIPGGARLTQTVVSKDVDIALTGGAVINAILGGADLVFVGVAVPTYAFSLYAKFDVKAVPDLRGKTPWCHHQRCVVGPRLHCLAKTIQDDATRHEGALLLPPAGCSGRSR
jgi:hypothetical protein